MKVILLAAGQSKRVQPIEDKNFITFCGKYLIQWQLEALSSAGLTDIVIVAGFHNIERIQEFVRGFVDWNSGLAIHIAEQKTKDGMAGGVRACQEFVGNESVLIISSNDVVDTEAYQMMAKLDDRQADQNMGGAILGYEVSEYFPGGYLELGHKNQIEGIIEKPGEGSEPSNYVNIVLHYHVDYMMLLNALDEAKTSKDDQYEVALDNLIKSGKKYTMMPYNGYWQPLKFPWHIFVMDEYFVGRKIEEVKDNPNFEQHGEAYIHTSVSLAEGSIVKGPAVLEEGVRVFENAVIKGPAYLGVGTVVANQALFRNSTTGEKCVVGFSTEIARSHIGDDVWTHSNYVGDSVIGNNVSFGAGAITANLRLDEDYVRWQGTPSNTTKLGIVTGNHVRVGVQSCIMPGITLGKNSVVGAGIVLNEDVNENEIVYGKTELVRKPNKLDISDIRRN